MQAVDFASALKSYAQALEKADARRAATWLQAMACALEIARSMTTEKLVATIRLEAPAREPEEVPTLGHVEPVLSGLFDVLSAIGAKKALVTDVGLLLDLSRRHGEVLVREFESAVESAVASASRDNASIGALTMSSNKNLADVYLDMLEATLGDDARFRVVYKDLNKDKRIGKCEAVEIASRFFAPLPPSTTRPKALQKIMYRHEKLLESRAASGTIGGKAA
jgi:hypothetical protein